MKRITGMPTVEQLQSIRLFRGVERPVLLALLERLETCEVDAEELLLSPHTLNRHLYMLVRGQLSVQLASRDNPPVRYVEVNDCVGEVSFCDHRPPSAYVIASEPSRVLRLHSRELPFLTQSPQLMQNLIELLCDRVRLTDQLIINSEHNANIDVLTGVFNRRWLEHIFERESARCAFNGRPLCMLMIDVDEFKPYNDRHGHIAGDHALCQVARLLGTQLRPKDSLVRFGGEEFVILLPELDLRTARLIAERLRQGVAQNDTIDTPIGSLPGVTISVGLARMRASDTLEDLVGRADKALYLAKARGRNRVCG